MLYYVLCITLYIHIYIYVYTYCVLYITLCTVCNYCVSCTIADYTVKHHCPVYCVPGVLFIMYYTVDSYILCYYIIHCAVHCTLLLYCLLSITVHIINVLYTVYNHIVQDKKHRKKPQWTVRWVLVVQHSLQNQG